MVGVNYQTFANWVQKRRRERGSQAPTPIAQLRWVEAVLESGGTAAAEGRGGLSVHLPGGARLEILDARQTILAAELLRILATKS